MLRGHMMGDNKVRFTRRRDHDSPRIRSAAISADALNLSIRSPIFSNYVPRSPKPAHSCASCIGISSSPMPVRGSAVSARTVRTIRR